MKVSVSLPDDDLAFMDQYAQEGGLSRSAALHHAVEALRTRDLGDAYEEAWDEWYASGEAAIWECVIGDGLDKP